MKGDFLNEKDHHHHHHHHHQMFAKLQQQTPPHHLHLQPIGHHRFSEETPRKSDAAPPSSLSNDGATIEVVRRPRGRPPGSKNKPKPPVLITRDTEPSMNPYVLEIPGGLDLVDSLTRFCRRRSMGLCVLSGWGTVANVTLRQPSTTPGPSVTFHGRFDILSISATVLPSSMDSVASPANGFTLSLAGPQGQVVGGAVAGPLLTAGTVYVIAASFNSPSYHRLTADDQDVRSSGSGGNDSQQNHSPPAVSGGGGGESGHIAGVVDSCGMMSAYSCHLPPTDGIWTPIARQPPPPPY